MTDAHERVTGRIEFPSTIQRPRMLHARLLRATSAHARINSVDTSRAMMVRGVHEVLTGDRLRKLSLGTHFGPVIRDQPIVAIDKVRYVGEPVAAVAAEDLDAADEAVNLIEVDYEELPAVFEPNEARQPGAPLIHPDDADTSMAFAEIALNRYPGTNICHHYRLRTGDVESALRGADYVFDDTFQSPTVQHVPLETHACVAETSGGRLTIWTGSQIPFGLRAQLASIFRIPPGNVRVVVPIIGGGYGGKGHPTIEPVVAVLSYLVRRPVRLQLRRDEEFVTVTKHASSIRIVSGVTRDGVLTARKAECLFNTGAYADVGPRVAKNGGYGMAGPYRIPNVWVDSYAIYTNLPPAGAFRAFGVPQASWAYESQMDLIAERLGVDPIELRNKNLLVDGDELATGQAMEDSHLRELLSDVATQVGWSAPNLPSSNSSSRLLRGKGVACIIKGTVTPSISTAIVKLNHDSSVSVLASSVEMGQGIKDALASIVARELGVPTKAVVVSNPDTDVTPYDQQTSSSRSTYAMGSAVMHACQKIRDQLCQLAEDTLEIAPSDLELHEGTVRPKGYAGKDIKYDDLMRSRGVGTLVGDGSYRSIGGLDRETGRGIASVHWHQSAAAAAVEVDPETGKVALLNVQTSVYAGQVISRVGAELQSEGNIAFGLGQALFEELIFEDGQPQNPNLADYMTCSILDMPRQLGLDFLEDLSGGVVHGVGETSLPAVTAAIGNAISRAVGIRFRELPITPERILRKIRSAEGVASGGLRGSRSDAEVSHSHDEAPEGPAPLEA